MLVKDLPDDTELRTVQIRIPEDLHSHAHEVGLTKMEVYLWSAWMSGIWVKEDRFEDRVFPMQVRSFEVRNWEVVH